MWPIKEEDMIKEPIDYEVIFAYENVVSETKI